MWGFTHIFEKSPLFYQMHRVGGILHRERWKKINKSKNSHCFSNPRKDTENKLHKFVKLMNLPSTISDTEV
jgi:hypothetical protein